MTAGRRAESRFVRGRRSVGGDRDAGDGEHGWTRCAGRAVCGAGRVRTQVCGARRERAPAAKSCVGTSRHRWPRQEAGLGAGLRPRGAEPATVALARCVKRLPPPRPPAPRSFWLFPPCRGPRRSGQLRRALSPEPEPAGPPISTPGLQKREQRTSAFLSRRAAGFGYAGGRCGGEVGARSLQGFGSQWNWTRGAPAWRG